MRPTIAQLLEQLGYTGIGVDIDETILWLIAEVVLLREASSNG